MYRFVAIDLDDTLLSNDLSIHPRNLQALKSAKEKGVHVVLCSGRESASMLKIIEKMDVFDEQDYYISYNGAVVKQITGQTVWQDKIEGENLKKLIEIGRKHGVIVQCYCDSLVVETNDPRVNQYEANTGIEGRRIDDLTALPYSIKMLFNSLNHQVLEELKQQLEATLGEEYHYFFSKPEYLEVLYKTSNKGLAVEHLTNHLGIVAEEVISIGDSFNDSYMIEFAGLGVAMQNANPKVKEIADYVTENNNNQAGVAEVLEKFVLNEHGYEKNN